MRNILCAAVFLIAGALVTTALQGGAGRDAAAAPAAQEHGGHQAAAFASSASSGTCEILPPWFRSDASKVIHEKIGPRGPNPTGNSYFFMPHPVKHVIVHL